MAGCTVPNCMVQMQAHGGRGMLVLLTFFAALIICMQSQSLIVGRASCYRPQGRVAALEGERLALSGEVSGLRRALADMSREHREVLNKLQALSAAARTAPQRVSLTPGPQLPPTTGGRERSRWGQPTPVDSLPFVTHGADDDGAQRGGRSFDATGAACCPFMRRLPWLHYLAYCGVACRVSGC